MKIDHTLTLEYQLNAGWLTPYVDGLKDGKIIARQCMACFRISLPPVRSCLCGSSEGQWLRLNGTARIVKRTTGSDGDFAMVRFDGADTLSVVSLDTVPTSATTATIKPLAGKLPQLILAETSVQDST